jgi:glucose/arabinose dehydrogenase
VTVLVLASAALAFAFNGDDPPASSQRCEMEDPGLQLPDGFCATIFADVEGNPRHITASADGTVFVALTRSRSDTTSRGVLVLRDTDGDGVADDRMRFGDLPGTGIALYDGDLYFGANDRVVRYPQGTRGEPETIVSGLPASGSHRAKSIAITSDGTLYVNIGSPSNACQEEDRTAGSSGQDPCPELETRAGIWKFDANATGQTQADGERYATGLRNTVALALHPTGVLFGAVHGRDQLSGWPDLFNDEQNAEKPSEELVKIEQGDDFGWPYCYHDLELGRRVLAPEYGGDGRTEGMCREKNGPVEVFPAHWAPNGLVFYTGDIFPEKYRGGAFIAFHGSWNRAPLPQGGYNVVFVPFQGDSPAGGWEVFADGFAGENVSPRGAAHRPSGLAVGPDGSLYVTDDRGGRIWRITYIAE